MDDPNKFHIKKFKMIRDFVMEIQFIDDKVLVIDFSKINHKGQWEELENLDYFNKVRLNEIHNLEWPNGQDFNPYHLYYWDKFEKYYT